MKHTTRPLSYFTGKEKRHLNIDRYAKQFVDSKVAMDLPDVLKLVRYLLDHECKPNQKLRWSAESRSIYTKMKYVKVVCIEFEKELLNASPWEDYREILARLEWPYMHRVLSHISENRYEGPYGEKWRRADAWFVEMWTAYHILFMRMPGYIPDTAPWRMYDIVLGNARSSTAKYRREL